MSACLEILEPREVGGMLSQEAQLVLSGGERERLWFETDLRHRDHVDASGDAFVVAALRRAMRADGTMRIEGAPVSPSLIDNLEELQRAWRQWHGLAPVELAPTELAERGGDSGALIAFSGGIDSAYTLHRHATGGTRSPSLRPRAAVFAHGFDIPLEDASGFEGAGARAERMTASLGVELILVRTNVRAFNLPWPQFHGSAIAATLAWLGGRSTAGVIASSGTYEPIIVPYGSTPVTDPLHGSDGFSIRHDGAHATRAEKLEALSTWPEAMRWLRVCWEGRQRDRNCAACRKCVTVGLTCRALGIEPRFLERPLKRRDVMRVARTAPIDGFTYMYRSAALDAAGRHGVSERWIAAMRRGQARYRARRAVDELGSPRRRLRRMRRKIVRRMRRRARMRLARLERRGRGAFARRRARTP